MQFSIKPIHLTKIIVQLPRNRLKYTPTALFFLFLSRKSNFYKDFC